MLIEYKLGGFEANLGAKIASVTSGHNVTCFDYEVMISPLFRWPNSLCHYIPALLTGIKVRVTEYGEIIEHSLYLFSWRVWRVRTKVKTGVWEIDVISHRYRIAKLSENGDRYTYPYRVNEIPLFMFPVKVNES